MSWLRKWGWPLLAALLSALGLGGVLAARRRKIALSRAENDATVIAARSRVQELRATRAVLLEQSTTRTEELADVNRAIEEHKSAIATVQASHGLGAQEIADEFSRLGY